MLKGSRFSQLSSRQRKATPPAFARWLVERALLQFSCQRVAVLFVARDSFYKTLWPVTDCWDVRRRAEWYAGPWPVICHPPCGPWGRLRRLSGESREWGRIAVRLASRWGGVVEHPEGSSLFRECCPALVPEVVDQGCFGHPLRKRTLLAWFGQQAALNVLEATATELAAILNPPAQ